MMEAFVDTVTTELCGALLAAVNVRPVGEKPQEAELGKELQEKVNVPANPFAGVTVSVEVPVPPCVMVIEAGLNAALMEGGIAVMVMVCAELASAEKLPSPL
jgi:hypothetical protein